MEDFDVFSTCNVLCIGDGRLEEKVWLYAGG